MSVALGEGAARRRVASVRAAVAIAVWMGISGAVASTGALLKFDQKPPPTMIMLTLMIGAIVLLVRSPYGKRLASGLPIAALIGLQAFRLPLELLMHRAYTDGVMPIQLSFEGYNFDIVTGTSAAVLGVVALRRELPRRVVVGFNTMGFVLLMVIAVISIASTPTFAAFGDDAVNTWVGHVPFVWLPVVFVQAALLGHVLLWQRMRAGR